MKKLTGNTVLQDLKLRKGEKVKIGNTVYRYYPSVFGRGTRFDMVVAQ